jgi:hypothetical protein
VLLWLTAIHDSDVLTMRADHAGKNAGHEPWLEGHHAQYHGRRNIGSRYFFTSRPLYITSSLLINSGYWMPYFCAKAVCETFCYNIAGALVPIFGPDFPSRCVRPDAPDFGRMVIHPQIIAEATREAETYRRLHQDGFRPAAGRTAALSSPTQKRERKEAARTFHHDRRVRVKSHLVCGSPCSTDTDGDGNRSALDSASSTTSGGASSGSRYLYTSSGWTAANHHPLPRSHQVVGSSHNHFFHDDRYRQANPWLSAIPRFAPTARSHQQGFPPRSWSIKRSIDHEDVDYSYEGSESHSGSSPATSSIASIASIASVASMTSSRQFEDEGTVEAAKKAAMLLVHLSVQDPQGPQSSSEATVEAQTLNGHRSKRRRATSL